MRLLRPCLLFLTAFVSFGSFAQKNIADTVLLRKLTTEGKALVYQFPDSSLQYLIRASQIADSLGLKKQIAEASNWLGVAHYVMGEYDFALPYFTRALHLYEQVGDDYGLATAYNYIGLINQTQQFYHKAISYHKTGLFYAKRLKSLDRQSLNNFNIGLAFDELKNYDSAFYYLDLSLHQSRSAKEHRVYAMGLNRMGKVNYHVGKLDEAEALYDSALRYKDYQSNWEKCFAWAGLAEVYSAQGRYSEGMAIGLKSLELAKEIRARWDVIHVSEILSTLYAKRKMFEQAYNMSTIAQAYKDSVFSEEKENQLNYIQLKENEVATANLEKENAIQSAQLRQKDVLVIASAIVTMLCVILIIVLYSRHLQKVKLNEDLNEMNLTKSRLISILSHDMRSPFNSLHGLLELLRLGGITEAQRQNLIEELTENFRSVSGTLDNLLQWTHSQMEGLHANPKPLLVDDIIKRNLEFWEASIKKKQLVINYENKQLPVYADRFQLKTVIRNILGNSIKFTPVGGAITINSFTSNDKTCITISDTGIGMPEEIRASLFKFQRENQRRGTSQEKGTGLGMMISYQLLEKNGGTIEVESEEGKGSIFRIWLPATRKD